MKRIILMPLLFLTLIGFSQTTPSVFWQRWQPTADTVSSVNNKMWLDPVTGKFRYQWNGSRYTMSTGNGANIYNSNGTLTGNRTILTGGNNLNFSSVGDGGLSGSLYYRDWYYFGYNSGSSARFYDGGGTPANALTSIFSKTYNGIKIGYEDIGGLKSGVGLYSGTAFANERLYIRTNGTWDINGSPGTEGQTIVAHTGSSPTWGTPSTVTASNGITKVGNDIQLKGEILTSRRVFSDFESGVDTDKTLEFKVSNSDAYEGSDILRFRNQDDGLGTADRGIDLISQYGIDSTQFIQLRAQNAELEVIDSKTVKTGIKNSASGYVTDPLSLATKEYVDAAGGGFVVTGTQPTNTAITWVDSGNAYAGMYPVRRYINGAWQQVTPSIDYYDPIGGIISKGRPLTALVWGQSNTATSFTLDYLISGTGDVAKNNSITLWNADANAWVVPDFTAQPTGGTSNNWSWNLNVGANNIQTFAKDFIKATGRAIRIVQWREGGTPLSYWMPAGTGYTLLTGEASASGVPYFDLIIGAHGEGGTGTITPYTSYQDALHNSLIPGLRGQSYCDKETIFIMPSHGQGISVWPMGSTLEAAEWGIRTLSDGNNPRNAHAVGNANRNFQIPVARGIITSSTSVNVATATFPLSVTLPTGQSAFSAINPVVFISRSTPTAFFIGSITAYNSGSGAATISVLGSNFWALGGNGYASGNLAGGGFFGTGTLTDWDVLEQDYLHLSTHDNIQNGHAIYNAYNSIINGYSRPDEGVELFNTSNALSKRVRQTAFSNDQTETRGVLTAASTTVPWLQKEYITSVGGVGASLKEFHILDQYSNSDAFVLAAKNNVAGAPTLANQVLYSTGWGTLFSQPIYFTRGGATFEPFNAQIRKEDTAGIGIQAGSTGTSHLRFYYGATMVGEFNSSTNLFRNYQTSGMRTTGNLTVDGLAGSGSRPVVTDANGLLSASTVSGIGAWSLANGGTLTGVNTITGTTTNILKANFDNLSTTQTDGAGLWLANNQAATVGAQQVSPSLILEGQGWKTTATAGSQSVKIAQYVIPVQGTTTPTSQLSWYGQINAGSKHELLRLSDNNTAGTLTGVGSGNALSFENITGSLVVTASTNLYNGSGVTATKFTNSAGVATIDAFTTGQLTQLKINTTTGTIVGSTGTPTSTLQSAGSFAAGYVEKTANYTLTISDYIVNCTANSFTITLPTAVGITGRQYVIKNTGSATTITIATTSSQTIDGTTPPTVSTMVPLRVASDGANWITF